MTKKKVDGISRKKINEIAELLESHGWLVCDTKYFKKIVACSTVINVYKHGNGTSFRELKRHYPEYLHDPWGGGDFSTSVGINYLNFQVLFVTDKHIQEFSDAIIEFWKNVPDSMFI